MIFVAVAYVMAFINIGVAAVLWYLGDADAIQNAAVGVALLWASNAERKRAEYSKALDSLLEIKSGELREGLQLFKESHNARNQQIEEHFSRVFHLAMRESGISDRRIDLRREILADMSRFAETGKAQQSLLQLSNELKNRRSQGLNNKLARDAK